MKQWSSYSNALVLFTKNHWMTSDTFILYVDWLMSCFRGHKIGLVIDYAPSHDNDFVRRWVAKMDQEKAGEGTKIIID
jgi:hypothetical protein